ncbi:lytic transglycosylase domain-containing protein [Sphingomonas sp. AP4-R1]|nr:lytic transglycosylase domain-containing protein [Sphingomonas sp. AP4-R1]
MSAQRIRTAAPRRRSTPAWALIFLLGPASGLAPLTGASAQSAGPVMPTPSDPYAAYIAEASQRFGVPEMWIRAVMRVESRGDVRALSPKGAMGLMQIMPATWGYLRARYGLGINPYDTRDNILAGAAYLRELRDRYDSPGFLAAYNAGPGRYEDYRATGRPLPPETIAYVAAIAPVIGAEPLSSSVPATAPDPFAWTRSALFVSQTGSNPSTPRPQPDEGAAPRPLQTADSAGTPRQDTRDTIFVARAPAPAPR